jgi:uncharacterized protein YjbI with pentapeptide repeats
MATDIPPPHTSTGDGNGGIAILFAGILAGVVLTGLAMVFLAESMSWDWKTLTGSESPNLIEAWRNLGLIALGVVGIGLATWRSILAHQQNQNAIAQRRISERGINVDRYQKGAQMLESDELSVRVAGIYGLRELAISDPEESYIIVQSLLCAFIREKSKIRAPRPAEDEAEGASKEPAAFEDLSPDALEALDATIALRKAIPGGRQLEAEAKWFPSLASANLSGARLYSADLSDAKLAETNLSDTILAETNLSGADLAEADLSGANLFGASLSGTDLFDANLSGADLSEADLFGAELFGANLSDAKLGGANLSGTFLFKANLSDANLSDADLSAANLFGASLSGTFLFNANLSGVNLSEVDLSTAELEDVLVDEQTVLTDIWAWADRPPVNMPPQIEAAITYRDPAERKDDD